MAYCGVTKAAKPVLYDNMLSYMRGYLFGLPALIAVQILGPIYEQSGRRSAGCREK